VPNNFSYPRLTAANFLEAMRDNGKQALNWQLRIVSSAGCALGPDYARAREASDAKP